MVRPWSRVRTGYRYHQYFARPDWAVKKFLPICALLTGNGATEDTLAYSRDAREFKNCLLAELLNGDCRNSFTAVLLALINICCTSNCSTAAIHSLPPSQKALKEVTYHLRWSSEWVIRLGDGTAESRQRILNAIEDLWMFTGELFKPADYEIEATAKGFGVNVESLKNDWLQNIKAIFEEATLPVPDENAWMQTGGKNGSHTEHLGFILADMQFLQRTYPGCEW